MTDPALPTDTPPPPASPNGAVTIRGLTPALKSRLRVRAAHNARSMEAEARAILEAALTAPGQDLTDLAAFARALFDPLGGIDLDPRPPGPVRGPPDPGTAEAPPPPEVTEKPRAPAGKKRGSTRRPTPPSGRRRR